MAMEVPSIVRRVLASAALFVVALLLAGCMSSDEKLSKELETTIKTALRPGDDAETIERVGLEHGWRLRRELYGYIGHVPDPRVSSSVKSLQIVVQVDDERRFVDARVRPYPVLEKPLH